MIAWIRRKWIRHQNRKLMKALFKITYGRKYPMTEFFIKAGREKRLK